MLKLTLQFVQQKIHKNSIVMKFVIFLFIGSVVAPSLMNSLGDKKLVDSAHPFKSNPYEDILEELKGAHIRFAATHVSLMRTKRNTFNIIILKYKF